MKSQEKGTKKLLLLLLVIPLMFSSCKKEQSGSTGWNYNDPKNGGFQKIPYLEQETGPGLVLIEGGRFTMGRVEQELHYDWNNIPRTVTVSSFYMDETEVTNFSYLEYLYWLERVYNADYPEVYKKALPDTLVWRSKLAYNEPYVEYYLRHPAYRDYPVVGVNWLQANDYCSWRTDRVNEIILIREGLFEHYPNQINEDNFNTESYLVGQYESGKRVDGIPDLNPNKEYRNVRIEDGILLPKYRLPTEAEWEYAARGGRLSKNYVYAGGNKMSKVGWFRDNSDMGTGRQSHPVGKLKPNELGLYDMSGNISEWCADSYLDKYDSAPVTNPLLVNEKDLLKVTRGSSFYFGTSGARPSARDFEVSSTKENLVGLRLAL